MMDIKERIALNLQKINGIQARLDALEVEKQDHIQEALRLGGEIRVLNEMLEEGKKQEPKKEGE